VEVYANIRRGRNWSQALDRSKTGNQGFGLTATGKIGDECNWFFGRLDFSADLAAEIRVRPGAGDTSISSSRRDLMLIEVHIRIFLISLRNEGCNRTGRIIFISSSARGLTVALLKRLDARPSEDAFGNPSLGQGLRQMRQESACIQHFSIQCH
jgi:hypothetical protein